MKEFDIKDIEEIKQYLHYNYNHSYNANINTMIMWNHFYNISYECHENYMIMLYSFFDEYFWFMPYCHQDCYTTAIQRMKTISRELQIPFHISFCTEEFKDFCLSHYSDQFLYKRADYNDDYIYDLHEHMSLKGKSMQKRRNHYNYFIHHYEYEFQVLDPIINRDDIIECFNNWNEKSSHASSYELDGIMNLLDYGRDIYCCGLYIDNKIEALSISSVLNDNTVQIHVEKANKEFRGIYPALLKFVLESQYKDFKYINREDDIGVEGLRTAKTQLHPVMKLDKYELIEKNFNVLHVNQRDEEDIKSLWIDSFEDEDIQTTEYYFNHIFNIHHTYKLVNHDELIGVIQLNPMLLSDNEDAYYIVGVCIKSEYQRQGCMDYMLKYILERYEHKRLILTAYNPLVYKKYGFEESHRLKEYFIPKNTYRDDLDKIEIDINKMLDLYNEYIQNFKLSKKRTYKDFCNILLRLESYNEEIVLCNDGYMIYSMHDNINYISEIIYCNIDTLKLLIGCINEKDVYVLTDNLCHLNHDYANKIAMMSNSIEYNENHYIHELF